ncbi:hypothetical protein C8R44DRAFT_725375 [Mycena epipterygia]|nr:hypothetical protein C8R44DRAFT_725375 [Mycena epipterygia]
MNRRVSVGFRAGSCLAAVGKSFGTARNFAVEQNEKGWKPIRRDRECPEQAKSKQPRGAEGMSRSHSRKPNRCPGTDHDSVWEDHNRLRALATPSPTHNCWARKYRLRLQLLGPQTSIPFIGYCVGIASQGGIKTPSMLAILGGTARWGKYLNSPTYLPTYRTPDNGWEGQKANLAHFVRSTPRGQNRPNSSVRDAVYHLCSIRGLYQSAIPGFLPYVRIWDSRSRLSMSDRVIIPSNGTEIVSWVYHLLETLDVGDTGDTKVIGDLVQLLFSYRHIRVTPSILALQTVLSCFTSCRAAGAQYLAFRVLVCADHWFQDQVLMPVLQRPSVWEELGVLHFSERSMDYDDLPSTLRQASTIHYIALVHKLSSIPAWNRVILDDIPSWLSHLPHVREPKRTTEEFCAVLHRIWGADVAEDECMEHEKPLAMAFAALGNVWDQFNPQRTDLFRLIRCTVDTAFCARIHDVPSPESEANEWHMTNPSPKFKDIIMVRLADSLTRAAGKENASEAPNTAADLLLRLASTIAGELRNRWSAGDGEAEKIVEIAYWRELRQGLYDLTDE